jgi:hypothetical protein
MPYELAKEFDR